MDEFPGLALATRRGYEYARSVSVGRRKGVSERRSAPGATVCAHGFGRVYPAVSALAHSLDSNGSAAPRRSVGNPGPSLMRLRNGRLGKFMAFVGLVPLLAAYGVPVGTILS